MTQDDVEVEVRDKRRNPFYMVNCLVFDAYGSAIGAEGLAVYSGLARYANHQTGQCFPSQALLAKRLSLSRNTVRKYLALLAHVGLIASEPRTAHGAKVSHLYTLLEPPALAEAEQVAMALAAQKFLLGWGSPADSEDAPVASLGEPPVPEYAPPAPPKPARKPTLRAPRPPSQLKDLLDQCNALVGSTFSNWAAETKFAKQLLALPMAPTVAEIVSAFDSWRKSQDPRQVNCWLGKFFPASGSILAQVRKSGSAGAASALFDDTEAIRARSAERRRRAEASEPYTLTIFPEG